MVRFSNINIALDYYPFGMLMPGRQFTSQSYSYGFGGEIKDDEVKGVGNSIAYDARMLDTRLMRWLSLDPLQAKYPSTSPFAYVRNNPILRVDIGGEWDIEVHAYNNRAKFGYAIAIVKNKSGQIVAQYNVKVTGQHRDRMLEKGDSPTGIYKIGDSGGVWDKGEKCAYGPNYKLRMEAQSGEIKESGRTYIQCHGGRQTDDCDDASWIDKSAPLQDTWGCIRFFDSDIANMKNITDNLTKNDPSDSPGTLTLQNDLQFDPLTKSYIIKNQAESIAKQTTGDVMGDLTNSMIIGNREQMQEALSDFKNQSLNAVSDSKSCVNDESISKTNIKPKN